jgi:ketosteroid isomerase-like protein
MKILTACFVVLCLCTGCASRGVAESDIRLARADLNAALTNKNLQSMASYWLPDVNTIGGDGSLWAGKDKNVAGFAQLFNDPNFVSGQRILQSVEVSKSGPQSAAEVGTWEWRERVGGDVLTFSGRYLIMWNFVDSQWRIRSELYVSTGCLGGAGCQ